MFLDKLCMDLMTAMILEELLQGFKCGPEVQYALPSTGGRVLMSEPGRPAHVRARKRC
jgi:hypothetical protein